MIYLNNKADHNMPNFTEQAERVSIVMSTPTKAVTAVDSCDIVAEGPGAVERIKAMAKSVTGRSKILLASISLPVLAACGAEAQEAPKTQLVASNNATTLDKVAPATEATAPKTETPVVKVGADGKLDMAALLAQAKAKRDSSADTAAQKTEEATQTTEELAQKTAESEALERINETLESPAR